MPDDEKPMTADGLIQEIEVLILERIWESCGPPSSEGWTSAQQWTNVYRAFEDALCVKRLGKP